MNAPAILCVGFAALLATTPLASAQEPTAPAPNVLPAEASTLRLEAGAEVAVEGAPSEEGEAPPKTCPVPDNVRVGSFVNNIQSLDLKTHTYEFDAYLWFKWCNPEIDPAATMEFLNPNELWGMMVTPIYEEPEQFDDGTLYQVLRVQGRFNTKMPLYDYPFDQQRIGPIFEDSTHDASVLVYVPDKDVVEVNPELSLPGYLLGTPALALSRAPYATDFGDTRTAEKPDYARAALTIPLSRPLFSQVTLLFAPVACVVICAALMYLLRPNRLDSRIGVGTTAMLTIVALQMTYNQELPDVGYLMLMDKIYLASYLYVLCGLAIVMRTTPKLDNGTYDPSAERTNHLALIAFSTAYLAVCVVLCWMAAANAASLVAGR
jgi:hypothetical protein